MYFFVMPENPYSKNVQTVIDILHDEVRGDTHSALEKMTDDYTMTWVYETRKGVLFPSVSVSKDQDLDDAYVIKDRKYEIMHIAEADDVVMVELIESYPDPDSGEVYRTPLVLVLEMQDGKTRTGRYYCDPQLSYKYLAAEQVQTAYAKNKAPLMIIE